MGKAKIDACMICAPDPCECFAPKAKAKTAPRPKKKPPVEEGSLAPAQAEASELSGGSSGPPRQDLRAKMKAAAANAPKVTIRAHQPERQHRRKTETDMVRAAPAARPVISDEQLLLNAALRALGDIMAPEEREQYKMILGSNPSPDERKAEWKARRRAHVD